MYVVSKLLQCTFTFFTNTEFNIPIHSGPAGLRHPAIFGIYDLDTISEEYPAYVRHISGQYMFYKANYEHWDYSHKIER
jgi:hypothetical protein